MKSYKYPVVIQPAEEGGYVARIPDLKGSVAWEETPEKTLELIYEVGNTWLEIAEEDGWEIPAPTPLF